MVAALTVISTPTAVAESPTTAGDVLWLVDADDDAQRTGLTDAIGDALGTERGAHLVGRQQLADRIADGSHRLPDCALGTEACGRAEAIAFDALGIGWVVRLRLDAGDDTFKINYDMVDRRGEIADSDQIEYDDLETAGLEIVRRLFDAVGVVSFESTPSQATVFIDGDVVGETPLSEQLGIGTYDYRIEYDDHRPRDGRFALTAGDPHRVEVTLEQRPGRLRLVGAPDDATVWADDEQLGRASEVVELAAGHHTVELRRGDESLHRLPVTVSPGTVTEVDVDISTRPGILRDVETDQIAARRLQFDLGLEIGGQMARFPNARGTDDDGRELIFGEWIGDGDDEQPRRFVSPAGLRFGVDWQGDHLGLGLLSISYAGRAVDESLQLLDRADGSTTEATMQQFRRLQIRPMQVGARFFYENLAPYARGGFGVTFEWMDVSLPDGNDIRIRQVEPFGAAELGVRYHFDPRWSVAASYRAQGHLAGGTGFEHILGINVGIGLRNIPFVDPQPPGEL